MNRILVVVDYQADFVDGALGFKGAELLDEPISQKIREYGEGHVFYTLDTHFSDYLSTREGKNLPIEHCIKGTPGWLPYGKTADALKAVNAVALEKRSFGLDISDPSINAILPERVDEIELVGLVSSICVISNAVIFQTKYPEARVTVCSKLTAGADEELHAAALKVMAGFQVNVK